jgi:hypothetical protein
MLVAPGGGLNSRISNWATAVINAMEEFKSDLRCITMDQRSATGGESTGNVIRRKQLAFEQPPQLRWWAAPATEAGRSRSITRGALSPMTS